MRRARIRNTIIVGLGLVLALNSGASANPAGVDGGVVRGTAYVGKVQDSCSKDGGRPAGAGIGLPLLSNTKNAFFSLEATVKSVQHGDGTLHVCGKLSPALTAMGPLPGQVKPGIGPTCALSKGYDGVGKIVFAGQPQVVIWLNKVGWKASLAGVTPITGEANTTATKGSSKDGTPGSTITLPSFHFPAEACLHKRDATGQPKGWPNVGATEFMWSGGYMIDPKPYSSPNSLPGFCKNGPPCLYAPKK